MSSELLWPNASSSLSLSDSYFMNPVADSSEQGMEKEESEAKAEKTQQMNEVSQVNDQEDSGGKKKYHTLSDASPSVTHYSPSTPPTLRSEKPPSPPLHSSEQFPISDDHSSAPHSPSPAHDKRFSPPPQHSPLDSSSDSSISSDLCSVTDGAPPAEDVKAASSVVVTNRFQVEPKVVTKIDPGAQEGVVGVKDVEEGTGGGAGCGGDNRRLRPDVHNLLRSKKEAKLNKALLGLRIVDFVLCLISFSVLAADREQGWALDSFYVYKEFRYVAESAIGIYGLIYIDYEQIFSISVI